MGVSPKERAKVREITLDMADSMKTIAKKCFPKAIQVTDHQKTAEKAQEHDSGKFMGGHKERPGPDAGLPKTHQKNETDQGHYKDIEKNGEQDPVRSKKQSAICQLSCGIGKL